LRKIRSLLSAAQRDDACGEHQSDGASSRADPPESDPVHFPTIAINSW
jgi:hypothetical protein